MKSKVFVAASVVIRPAIDNVPFFLHILAPGTKRVLDRVERSVKQRVHLVAFVADEFGYELSALGRVGFAGGEGAADAFGFGDLCHCGAPEASGFEV